MTSKFKFSKSTIPGKAAFLALITSGAVLNPATVKAGESATEGSTSSDQTRQIIETSHGQIENYENQLSARAGTYAHADGPIDGISGELSTNLGRVGIFGGEHGPSKSHYGTDPAEAFSALDLRGKGDIRFRIDENGVLDRIDASADALSLLNYQIQFYDDANDPHPFRTFDVSAATLGGAIRLDDSLDYKQAGLSVKILDISSHRSISLGSSALLDFCWSLQPVEFLLKGEAGTREGQRNHYESNTGFKDGATHTLKNPVERISPTGMAQVCAGLTSQDGKWKVKNELTLVTDYVQKSENEGYGELRNTLSVERGPVGVYYSLEKAHQGEHEEKTHEVGITFKRKSKSAK